MLPFAKIILLSRLTKIACVTSVSNNSVSTIYTAPAGSQLTGLVLDQSEQNLYIANYAQHTILKMNLATQMVATFAGVAGVIGTSDGSASTARFNAPWGIIKDAQGNLYISDSANNSIRKIVLP